MKKAIVTFLIGAAMAAIAFYRAEAADGLQANPFLSGSTKGKSSQPVQPVQPVDDGVFGVPDRFKNQPDAGSAGEPRPQGKPDPYTLDPPPADKPEPARESAGGKRMPELPQPFRDLVNGNTATVYPLGEHSDGVVLMHPKCIIYRVESGTVIFLPDTE